VSRPKLSEPHHWERKRPPVRLTLDPTIRAEAARLADLVGLPLSRYFETLVRAELERERKRQR
jgi:hypothetical protein